jgi:hypothetical protein
VKIKSAASDLVGIAVGVEPRTYPLPEPAEPGPVARFAATARRHPWSLVIGVGVGVGIGILLGRLI